MKRCLSLLLSVIICALTGVTVFAADIGEKTVKVGFFSAESENGESVGSSVYNYDKNYLETLSDFIGVKFEFIDCKTRSNALNKLEKGQIDLVGSMTDPQEYAGKYEFCENKYGVSHYILLSGGSDEIEYEDFEHIGKSKIGYVKLTPELDKFLKSNNISPQLVKYNSESELMNALNKKEIDLISTNSLYVPENTKLVSKYATKPMYFASWNGNTSFINKLNDTIFNYDIFNSEFQSNLFKQYFPEMVVDPFTKAELDFIASSEPIKLYFESSNRPLSYFDEETKNVQGVLVDLSKLIAENTGLNISFGETNEKDMNSLGKNEFAYTLYDEKSMADSYLTSPIYKFKYYFYCKSTLQYNPDKNQTYRIAVPKNRMKLEESIKESYPNYEIIPCENPDECFKLIKNGRADLLIVNFNVAKDYTLRKNISDIILIPTSEKIYGISLEITGENSQMLTSIINKGIVMSDKSECQNIFLNYALNISPETTLSYLVSKNIPAFLFIVLLVSSFLIWVIIFVENSRIIKKQHLQLSETNKVLEKANNAKTDFLSKISHDIRTPMNAIIGITELAKRDVEDPVAVKGYLEQIYTSSKFMSSMLNDVLDMTKIENNVILLHPECYSFAEFKQHIQMYILPLCEKKNIQFNFTSNVPDDMCIMIDKVRIDQIIFNLLTNSVKYTDNGGKVSFDVSYTECKTRINLLFSIKDNGIGISHEFQKHLFEPFASDENNNGLIKENNGAGLGLTIVKELVDLMGGTINVSSVLGFGTEFTVNIETEKCTQKQNDIYYGKMEYDFNGKRALLCEDHPLNTRIVKKMLEICGMEVVCAENGKVGLEIFKNSPENYFNIILMDIRMPVLDGLKTTKAIRSEKNGKKIPIIALSANAFDDDVKKSMEAGVDEHLSKPIDPQNLYWVINRYINRE